MLFLEIIERRALDNINSTQYLIKKNNEKRYEEKTGNENVKNEKMENKKKKK
jgi:hypothetical protein